MLQLGAMCNFAIALAHLLFYFTGEKVLRFFGAPRSVIAIGVIYVLRGAEVVLDVIVIVRTVGRYVQFLGFSLISLCVGLLYLKGTAGVWRQLAQRA
ncbi:MAG: hypothetical protein LAN64_12470 [Acidobacteriia bacterium]|nr:hypothetical protein [Terriglobia bacterium]